MRTRVAFGLVALLAASGCTANTFIGGDGGTDNPPPVGGGAGKDGGSEGGQTDAAVPPGCDATKLPTDDGCVINDAEGIFVSSSKGTAVGDGTLAKPIGSLDAGIAAAKHAGKRVYACAETYAEAITLQDGVSVFGYFDCNNGWAVGAGHARVQPTTSPAARASNITTPTRVEAVDIVAPDFMDKSQSSIGLIANASPSLTVVHATIHAGTGGKGDAGANGIQLTDSGSAKNGGNTWAEGVCTGTWCANSVYNAVPGGVNTCSGEAGHDPAPGGSGGFGGKYDVQSLYDPNISAWTHQWAVNGQSRTDGSGGIAGVAQGGTQSVAPANGTHGAAGTDGSSGGSIGVFSASGYANADGVAGTAGLPGQSGGGAAGVAISNVDYPAASYPLGTPGWGEPGPGGGAGGCPGLAGVAGKGGGASVAIISVQSPFVLDHVTVEATTGGNGGAAGKRSSPTSGGTGGAPVKYTKGAGSGGMGGLAGVSGNGGGGPSIGMAYQGGEPQLLASTTKSAAGGSGVAQRVYVDGTIIPASPDSFGQDVYPF